ncbi:MAG: hypothetical protein PHN31_07015, partial [Candidatus Gracilibacteria bacterium]|nr:hypothetical protein [Candidatus Gracilibacteria bacterium]
DTAIKGFPGAEDFIGKERIKDYKDVDDTIQQIIDRHIAIQNEIIVKDKEIIRNNEQIIKNNEQIIKKNNEIIGENEKQIKFLRKILDAAGEK